MKIQHKMFVSLVSLVSLMTSGPAFAGSCVSAVFVDGFESGDMLPWQGHAALSDDFELGDLVGWDLLNPGEASLTVDGGELAIEPQALTLWFNDSTSIFVSKNISGNFKATAFVRARSLANPGLPPGIQFRLGGLMARNPDTTTGENYVFLVVGADVNDVSVEHKTTVNSVSTFDGPPWPDGEGEIRLCRVDCELRLYIRESGGAWQLQMTYDRPDLPPVVQVGPLAYANGSPGDLRVTYDRVEFAEVASTSGCVE